MPYEAINSSKALGRKIRQLRREQGVTQAQLAGLANTGVRFVSDLENGKETCQLGKMLRVLSTLGVDIDVRNPYDKDR